MWLKMRFCFGFLIFVSNSIFIWQIDAEIDESVKVFEFQPDRVPTVDSSATLLLGDLLPPDQKLTDFSLCLRLQLFQLKATSSYASSYATSDERNNELNFGIKREQFLLTVAGNYEYSRKTLNFGLNRWYHICATADLETKKLRLYLDGSLDVARNLIKWSVDLNGSLVLGQETDAFNGGFSAQQSFSGRISQFNLYNRVLSPQEVLNMSSCDMETPEGELVSWARAEWELMGVNVIRLPRVSFCQDQRKRHKVVPHKISFSNAEDFCRNYFRSSIFSPVSEAENERLYDDAISYLDSCRPKNHATGFLWIGLKEEDAEGVWYNARQEEANFTNFRTNLKFSSKQDCVAMEAPPFGGRWNDVSCNSHDFCLACEGNDSALFLLRGICLESSEEHLFVLGDLGPETQRRDFRGYIRYDIVLQEDKKTWELINIWDNQTIASIFLHDGSYPIGTRNWTVEKDYALCNEHKAFSMTESQQEIEKLSNASIMELLNGVFHTMTLSTCSSEEYTCLDGTCLPLSERCDLKSDCSDSSDERNCDKLSLPDGYLEFLPPPAAKKGPLGVNISIVVLGMSEIDHQNMRVTLDLTMTLEWYDLRLSFANLKEVEDLNLIDPKDVWTMKAEFLDADFRQFHESEPTLKVLKKSNPEPDDLKTAIRDQVYLGSKNPLKLHQRVKGPFDCHMDLANFPFDIQTCSARIKSTVGSTLVRWTQGTVKYEGETLLTEFEVGRVWISSALDGNYSIITFHFQLLRRYSYYITTAYLPTLMLMVISYASLFCKLENVDLRVMMSITILLVLYSLYQQISDGLPKTSYSKAIDIWCFFALILIFSQVVLHVVLEKDGDKYESTDAIVSFKPKKNWDKKMKALKVSRCVYLVVFIVFCCIYWATVISHWIRKLH